MAIERIQYTIENGDTVISVRNTTAAGFLKLEGRTGFGVAPTSLMLTEGSIEGSRWRRTRRGARAIDLPLGVFGTDRADVEAKLRLLIKTLSDRNSVARLVATYPDGARIYTSVHYSGGLDPQYGPGNDTRGQEYCRIVLTLVAPKPYWTEETAVQYSMATASGISGTLIPDMAEMRLTSSQAMGILTMENDGDVDAYPVWVIKGPATKVTIALGPFSIVYDAAISASETVTIDAVAKTVTSDLTGNVYANLDIAPKFFPIPPGTSDVSVVVLGSTTATQVSAYFNPRRELVY